PCVPHPSFCSSVTSAFSVSADEVVLVLSVPSAALCYLCGKTFPSFLLSLCSPCPLWRKFFSSNPSPSPYTDLSPIPIRGLPVPVLKSSINTASPGFQKNFSRLVELLTTFKNEEEQILQGGGPKAIDSQHKKSRLTARERIAALIDPGTPFFELGLYAAYEMYEEWGGAPAAGAITGLGRVSSRMFMLIANDATVKAGAFFPMTAKKVIRAQNIAIDNH